MTPDTVFLTLGALFLAGLAADALGHRTRLPRVTLLLLIGLVAGRSGLDLIPREFEALFGFISTAALTMVAFLLGNALTMDKLRRNGRMILWVSWCIVAATVGVVTLGLWAIGLALPLALILAGIATATAPAATQDILAEMQATGRFADTVRGIVAIDDAWGLMVFSLLLVAAGALSGNGTEAATAGALLEILGSVGLGVGLGVPAAALTGRLQKGQPQQAEALGLVCLIAGFAAWLDLSFLLAGMSAGAVVANLARHHERAFHEIEHIQWPFMLLFFLMAGAVLEVDQVLALGGVGIAYVALRIAGRLIGGWVGGGLAGARPVERVWIGPALLPQAGVAVGMALVAAETFPAHAGTIMTLTVGTTVIFEILGPPVTRLAVGRVAAATGAKPGPAP
jgi:Kef-type K+ transport system membrane component KefB